MGQNVLVSECDVARSDDEWRQFLADEDFGHVIAAGVGRALPVVAAAHYAFDGVDTVELHLHQANPLWTALAERAVALFDVTAADVYIPTGWNTDAGCPPEWAAPTSYYASVQATARATVIDEPAEIAAVLRRQLARLQPEGGHSYVEPGDSPFGRMLSEIRGLRLQLTDIRARFKFGNNKTGEERRRIAQLLLARNGPNDRKAREHLLRRLVEERGAP